MGKKTWCGVCSKEIARVQKRVECNGVCGCSIHMECAQINEEELKLIESHENVQYVCDRCTTDCVKVVNNKVDGIYEILGRMERQLSELHAKASDRRDSSAANETESYAKATAREPNKVVLVRPKNNETDSKKTIAAVKARIDPTAVKIKAVKSIAKGGVAIECSDGVNMLKVKQLATEKLSGEFSVEVAKKRNPMLKIVGIDDKLEDAQLCENLKAQNDFLSKDSEIKVLRKYRVKDRHATAIVELSAASFNECMKQQKLNLGWERCKVYEEVPILMCLKCCRYGHFAKECTNEMACKKCGGDHMISECTEKKSVCCNCKLANEKHNLGLKTDHDVNDPKCEVRRKKIQLAKRNVRVAQ